MLSRLHPSLEGRGLGIGEIEVDMLAFFFGDSVSMPANGQSRASLGGAGRTDEVIG